MVRTACRRFVLPTPQSRWRIDTPTRLETPAGSGAGDIMPFNNAAERALRGIAVGRKSWLFAGFQPRWRPGSRDLHADRHRQAQRRRPAGLARRRAPPDRRSPGQPARRTPALELAHPASSMPPQPPEPHDPRPSADGYDAAAVGAREQPAASAEGNRAVILPMSGRKSKFVTAGTHSMGAAFGASMPSGGSAVMSFTSRSRPAWSSSWRHGCWIRPPAPGWGSGRRAWRYRR